MSSYCIYVKYFNQYAEGITGANRNSWMLLDDDGNGWHYKKDAQAAAAASGIKAYRERGKDNGYGEVGAKSLEVKYMRVRDALEVNDYMAGYNPYKFEPISAWR